MIIFFSDLDNTLIYSYKHDIGENKVCVEYDQGKELSFMTKKSFDLLKQINQKLLFVPTTTRTAEQYNRIHFGLPTIPYALVCNGGVLLINGKEDPDWYMESLQLVEDCKAELEKAILQLQSDKNRNFEIRFIRNLFLFTKSEKPEHTILRLKEILDESLVDICSHGVKVYIVPKKLDKGMAIERLKTKIGGSFSIAAGDSEFDLPMFKMADAFIAPIGLKNQWNLSDSTIAIETNPISDELLEYIEKLLEQQKKGRNIIGCK